MLQEAQPRVRRLCLSLAKREPIIKPIIDAIGTLRSLNVFYSTFLSAALDPDDRMRSSYNVAGTDTLRWSSSTNVFGRGANLQNIAKGDSEYSEEAAEQLRQTRGVAFPNIKRLFIPDPGYEIADADLSGADAAVVAHETNEEELIDAITRGIKLHSVVSKRTRRNRRTAILRYVQATHPRDQLRRRSSNN